MQYLVMMGVFFTMPLFLSLVLGLDAFETGLRMLPLSAALVVTAPAIPKLLPRAAPRQIVQAGLLVMAAGTILLAARFEAGAGAEITTLPFILLGIGMGALASQLGNVVVSAVPVERGSEAGGLQYTAQNIGSSLGTALVGGVVIAALGTSFLQGIQSSDALSAQLKEQATIQVGSGVEFASTADVEQALADTDLTEAEQTELLGAYEDAQLLALSKGMVVVTLFLIAALFMARRLPSKSLIPESETAVTGQTAPSTTT